MSDIINQIIDLLRAVEPLVVTAIPIVFGIWLKTKTKILEKKLEYSQEIAKKKEGELTKWRHDESLKIASKLKEVCNYYCDTCHVHTAYIQFENGTLATSKLSNMFFSCAAEDNRYSTMPKLVQLLQRVPYVQMQDWYEHISNSEYNIVYIYDKQYIDELFYNQVGVRSMLAGLVKNSSGTIVGVGIFIFDEVKTKEELNTYNTSMEKFISSLETIFLSYGINVKNKRKELNMLEDDE